MAIFFNDPAASPSSVGDQTYLAFLDRKAVIEARPLMPYTPLANSRTMPKNYGKTLHVDAYIPLLDDRNINDQGIDANGAVLDPNSYDVFLHDLVRTFDVEADATAAAAAINAIEAGVAVKSGAATPWTVTNSKTTLSGASAAEVAALKAAWEDASASLGSGNLYGSSKDIGLITSKLPVLSEGAARVNRVGFKRIKRTATLVDMGMFFEWTKDAANFDSDPALVDHFQTELVQGAVEVSEQATGVELLEGGTTVLYSGDATSKATLSPEAGGGVADVLTYTDFSDLSLLLDVARCPNSTKIIEGVTDVSTTAIAAARFAFIPSELVTQVKSLADPFNQKAFVPVHLYADPSQAVPGEIGAIDNLRFVQVNEMPHWPGAGAAVGVNPGYRATGGRYDVFAIMVIGSEAFSSVGYGGGGSSKFQTIIQKPGPQAANLQSPYGNTGFSSIQWYHAVLLERPERIGLLFTTAKQ